MKQPAAGIYINSGVNHVGDWCLTSPSAIVQL